MSSKTTGSDVTKALQALGIDGDTSSLVDDPRERVFEALVQLWKEKKGPPEVREVGRVVGLEHSSVGHHLNHLAVEGRVKKLRRGIWLPMVE